MPHPPIGLFAAVMGLVGLGLAGRAAAPLFPGVFRAPAYFTELWVALGLLAFAALVVLYARKIALEPQAVRAELTEPAKLGFAGAPGVAASLVAAGLAPYSPGVAGTLWWIALALNAAILVRGLARLAQLGFRTRELHPGWIVVCMGGIVLPTGGIALGYREAAQWAFCVGAAAGLLLVVPLLRAAPLPERIRPTWFILLAPPSLLYLNGSALFNEALFEAFFFLAIAVLAALLFYARSLHRWGFGPAWWSITFPLDAFALAATRYARDHGGPWKALAGFAVVLATLAVAWMVLRTIIEVVRERADARRNANARVQ